MGMGRALAVHRIHGPGHVKRPLVAGSSSAVLALCERRHQGRSACLRMRIAPGSSSPASRPGMEGRRQAAAETAPHSDAPPPRIPAASRRSATVSPPVIVTGSEGEGDARRRLAVRVVMAVGVLVVALFGAVEITRGGARGAPTHRAPQIKSDSPGRGIRHPVFSLVSTAGGTVEPAVSGANWCSCTSRRARLPPCWDPIKDIDKGWRDSPRWVCSQVVTITPPSGEPAAAEGSGRRVDHHPCGVGPLPRCLAAYKPRTIRHKWVSPATGHRSSRGPGTPHSMARPTTGGRPITRCMFRSTSCGVRPCWRDSGTAWMVITLLSK